MSREGIIADVDALSKAGIGGIFLMNIASDTPNGDVVYGSEPWWELFKLAVSEAAKHNIKLAFTSPGWSASGGPWITPEYGMQRIVWSEMVVMAARRLTRCCRSHQRTSVITEMSPDQRFHYFLMMRHFLLRKYKV